MLQTVTGSPSTDHIGVIINSADIPGNLLPANSVFIDQGSAWANPFVPGVHGNIEDCLDRYDLLLALSPEQLERIDELKGKDLICHRAPGRNHGETLTMLASINYRARLDWAEQIKRKHADKLLGPDGGSTFAEPARIAA